MRLSVRRGLTPIALSMSAFLLLTTVCAFASDLQSRARQALLSKTANWDPSSNLSPMGQLAQLVQHARQNQPDNGNGSSFHVTANGSLIAGVPKAIPGSPVDKGDLCFGGDEDCSDTGFSDGPGATQSETAIAIDKTGRHIVVGFKDFRGFNLPLTSVSGFAYSDDGGATFTDGGQLPTTGTNSTGLVFGDPDIRYIAGGSGCQFVYSSIYVTNVTVPGNPKPVSAQTMSVHRSTDCGHTWTGPFEVKPATLPTSATDAADKEFISVDPDTGRLGLSWSNFVKGGAAGVQIRFTYSDDVMTATPPTWSNSAVLNPASVLTAFDTGSEPRFAGLGSNNVYVAWAHQESFYTDETQVAVSHDNGSTFDHPVTLDQSTLLVPTFFIDNILGNDRTHQFPSIAVDNSFGRNHGNVYVAYATNADFDGADVVVHRSTDGGATWSEPTVLTSNPGADRAQWFPTVTVDTDTGRVNVVYDDQGVSTSGDVMEMEWVHSDDGGSSWSRPSPITRPFHAGYGNDTGQLNLGDYNASASQGGNLYTVFTITPTHASFVDGEPTSSSFPYPSFLGNTVAGGTAPAPGFVKMDEPVASLHLGTPSFVESGGDGFINPGDFVALTLPITNYVINPATSAGKYEGIQAFLSTSTPGVTVVYNRATYPNVAVGETQSGRDPFVLAVSPSFVAGTPIELSLEVKTSKGHTTLVYSQT